MGTVMNQAWMVEVMFTVPLNVLNTCLKHCKFSNPDNCATWWCESIIFQTLTLTEFIIWNTIDLYICTIDIYICTIDLYICTIDLYIYMYKYKDQNIGVWGKI